VEVYQISLEGIEMFYIRENQELKGWDILLKAGLENGEDWLVATFYDKKLAETHCFYYNITLKQAQFQQNKEKTKQPQEQNHETLKQQFKHQLNFFRNPHEDLIPDRQGRELL
jgi:hypothetical protein